MTIDSLERLMKRYYGGKTEFLRAVRINKKRLTEQDVKDILEDKNKGCMQGVAKYREFLKLLGQDIKIVDAE